MIRRISISAPVFVFLALAGCNVIERDASGQTAGVTIIGPARSTGPEALAAREIRRYLYLRTGRLANITRADRLAPSKTHVIVVARKDSPTVGDLKNKDKALAASIDSLQAQHYLLKTIALDGQKALLAVGGDAVGTLYAAYRFAEHLGVRFYMHGDTIPDRRIALELPDVDETGRPLFDIRGIQPFHDFPEGPDWWNADDYKAVIAQLPKLRMNFIGFHTYPEGGVGPEPLTWIGLPEDINPDGSVRFAYPSRHFVTGNVTGAWGYKRARTADYSFGAADLYERDDYGADYMRGSDPWNKMPPEQCSAMFGRMGALLDDAFAFARDLGIKTCIGTETPLTIPRALKERLKAAGRDPGDAAVARELYEGIFRRITKTHPLDYYWFWTPEGWTWGNPADKQIEATLADFRAAIAAADKVKPPFTLATCGWVLGPPKDRALFDNFLPKQMPLSCINRNVGFAFVEPGFARVKGRPKWAIPWMEDDPALIIPQLWAGRMRRDAADALSYGCTGLLGIHWRTRILGPNVSALAHAAWEQAAWNPDFGKKYEPPGPKLKEGREGGNVAHFPNNPMADTEDDTLYQSVIWDVRAYRFELPNGSYKVTLRFCEPHYDEAGKRVFSVKLQDKRVIDKLDLFAKVGKNRALDYIFADVKVTTGLLNIDFVHEVEFPCIAAIEVKGANVTRKINCGGPAYKDYQADFPAAPADTRLRDLPADDFYADWAIAQFGPEAAGPIAEIFTRLDGGQATSAGQGTTNLPRPSTWVGGPGGINPDPRPWDQVKEQYAFVDKLAALRPRIEGAGNLERFDYWLNSFRYLRAVAKVNCTWARFNDAMKKVKQQNAAEGRRQLAAQTALPIRKELIACVADVHRHLLATVTTPGAMGNVTNFQQHIMPKLLEQPGEELAKILGQPLPADAMPSKQYDGPARIIVPTVRGALRTGEDLKLKIIVLDRSRPAKVTLYWRPIGTGDFKTAEAEHVARAVYCAAIGARAIGRDDVEYYVEAALAGDEKLVFPASAPLTNQTVVLMD